MQDGVFVDAEFCDSTEVTCLAAHLNIPERHALGCIVAFWCWFDQNALDGLVDAPCQCKVGRHRLGISPGTLEHHPSTCALARVFYQIDRESGLDGLAEALVESGFLCVSRAGLSYSPQQPKERNREDE